jgi:hypothetical protein
MRHDNIINVHQYQYSISLILLCWVWAPGGQGSCRSAYCSLASWNLPDLQLLTNMFCEMWWKNDGSRFHPVISQVLQLRCWFSSLTWESRGTMTPCPRTFWWSTFSCLVSRMTMDAKPLVRGIPSKRLYFTENSMYLCVIDFTFLFGDGWIQIVDDQRVGCAGLQLGACEGNPRRWAQWSTDGRGHSNSSPKGPWPMKTMKIGENRRKHDISNAKQCHCEISRFRMHMHWQMNDLFGRVFGIPRCLRQDLPCCRTWWLTRFVPRLCPVFSRPGRPQVSYG